MPEPVASSGLRLTQLFPGENLGVFAEHRVGPFRLDSRKVGRNDTFLALTGTQRSGEDYIDAAIDAGASLILKEAESFSINCYRDAPVLSVPGLRDKVSQLAAQWYRDPSRRLTLIGITGTNGKTTCCQWLAQLLDGIELADNHAKGRRKLDVCERIQAATIGTLGYGLADEVLSETGMTTPDAVVFQELLADLLQRGANTVIAEVSSHSLDQGRVSAVDFDVAMFTNIGRDHLDYHGDLYSYVKAKTLLFQCQTLNCAVVNLDDEHCSAFIDSLDQGVQSITCSLVDKRADFYVSKIQFNAQGTRCQLHTPEGKFALNLPIWGEFNLRNLIAVVAAAYGLGLPLKDLVARVDRLRPVPGRLEAVAGSDDLTVLIDFAHTPDAIASVLTAVREHVNGNIWCVFGCGGDRDRGKRPMMAQVAEKWADYVVVTSDNPRNEAPERIISDIVAGFRQPMAVHSIEDRETAIRFAIEQASPGDCVLILGKGHEEYQLVGAQKLPFSDASVARLALKVRPASSMWSGDND